MATDKENTGKTTSYRLTPSTRNKLKELATLLRKSDREIIEDAIAAYYDNRENVVKKDMEERLKMIQSSTGK
ncbi:hypothetical protein GCM10027347_61230 [Larkinella harenae]